MPQMDYPNDDAEEKASFWDSPLWSAIALGVIVAVFVFIGVGTHEGWIR